MMFKLLLNLIAVAILHHKLTIQHYVPPPQPCLSAQICNHTGTALCGIEINEKHNRMFLDECDMFEYNCDNHKAYYPTEFSHCLQTPETTTTTLQTLSSTSVEVNKTTDEITKSSLSESDNVTKAALTETTHIALNITTEPVTTVNTSPTTMTTTSTSSESTASNLNISQTISTSIQSTVDTTALTTSTPTTPLLTTASTPFQTTGEITTESTTTTMPTSTLTTPLMITTSIPIQTTVESATEMITKISTIDDKNTTSATKSTSTTCTGRPQNITTSLIKKKPDYCSCTPSIKETSVTTALTEATFPTIYEKNNTKPFETQDTTSTKNQSVPTLVTCEYPKYCNRPHTWEVTAKGETRDFYQILKARYGNRVKILRDTTHWPRRITPNVNGIDDNFQFGRHNEGEDFD